ncbi:MAG TPA: GerW family sporulation protein [Bacillota bacterium]|nr:GerW family sporulation protein [Bacillota bacterium]
MPEHPIEGLMKTTMESLKEMVNVNTILGDPVETPDGNVIVPVSRVTFGFAAGGSEFSSNNQGEKDKRNSEDNNPSDLPFGGGSGAGITVNPVAFLVVGKEQTKLLPVDSNIMVDRIIEAVPQLFDKIRGNTSPKAMASTSTTTITTEAPH